MATALAPLGEPLRCEITATDYLQTDDTTITVLGEHGGSSTGRLWSYLARSAVRSSSTPHPRTNGTAPSASWPTFAARSKGTPIGAMTGCIAVGD